MKVFAWIKDVCERVYDSVLCWILDIYYFGLKPTWEIPIKVDYFEGGSIEEEVKAEEKEDAPGEGR